MWLWFSKVIPSVLHSILQDKPTNIFKKLFLILTSQTKLATVAFRLIFLFVCGGVAFFQFVILNENQKLKNPRDTYFRNKTNEKKLQTQLPFLLNECGDEITISVLYFLKDTQKQNTSIYSTFDIGFVQMLNKDTQTMLNLQDANPNDLPQLEIDKKHNFYKSSHTIYGEFNTLLLQKENYSYFCFTKDSQQITSSVLNTQCFIVGQQTNPIIKYAFENLSLKTIWAIIIKENDKPQAPVELVITLGIVNENQCSPQEIKNILKQISDVLLS